jgi:acetyl esterase/lipase
MNRIVSLALALACALSVNAQTRYLDEVFSDVTVTSNVIYGSNITVLPAMLGQLPAAQPLALDLYEPTGDTQTDRPLLLYFHTGNFLPQYVNGSALGNKDDNCAVEICTRMAKKGYVVASVDYRLGWNPLAGTQDERTQQLIQAAYRGVQDSRTAVRFFRKSVAESANVYGIDEEKIAMLGEGTGGYITLASATISSYNDIILDDLGSPILKFWYDPGDGSSIPMVIEGIHGNPDATTDTYAPPSSGGFQLCIANHVGYSSDFNFQANLGGALGDLNWLDEGDKPMVSFHAPHDPFAPYETGVLVVPTTGEPVVSVSGAYDIHAEINGYATSNNAIFQAAELADAGSPANADMDGLFPVMNSYVGGAPTEPYDASPWQSWDVVATQAYDDANGTSIVATQLSLNPTMGEAEALGWITQIEDYLSPRMGLALAVLTETQIAGGVRYVDEVFDAVDVQTNVIYGSNITVLPAMLGQLPAAQPLALDLYTPSGDTETSRPLILYFHTGNFLPQYVNGSALGNKDDSCAVEICERFARMGYVVASVDYRLGWNPLAGTQDERTLQLIQAAYRGVQDSRTAVRFFRKSIAESGNPYGVDDTKIAMFGEGTGGYITLASATISNYNDIIVDDLGQPISKFWYDPGTGTDIPMIVEDIHGDPNATQDGFAPASVGGFQMCIANHVGYSSDFNFQMNMGGAMGDLNWLDEGDMPMVGFHTPHDPFAPYETGVLVVPTTSEPVVSVSGAYDIHAEINGYATNNNASFASIGLPDPASATNNGWDGLYPVMNNYVGGLPSEPYDSSPWQWWDVATTSAVDAANGTNISATQLTLNPTMGQAEAMEWIDVIQDYTAPRLAVALGAADLGPGCNDELACNYSALATTDDGSCAYAAEGFDCDGNSTMVMGCTNHIACNWDAYATDDDGSCDFIDSGSIPTGADVLWLVGVTMTGTPYEPYAAGCEVDGGVNPNISINGNILGDGTGGVVTLQNGVDPTGLLGDLLALTTFAPLSVCGNVLKLIDPVTGGTLVMSENNGVWMSAVPAIDGVQYLWAAPMANFPFGCGDPSACGFTAPCDLSVACDYTDTDGDSVLDCQEIVGCTDPDASNYNENATDDGTCNYNGCMNADATNFNAAANTDDGSCLFLVILRVDMAEVGVSNLGVNVAGSFQDWDPGSTPATQVGGSGSVYELQIALSNGVYEYKFINGDTWDDDESVNGKCGAGNGNRLITVADAPLNNGIFCFGSCDSCAPVVVMGCTYEAASNYNAAANDDDGSCAGFGADCEGDLNNDGTIGVGDLLSFLGIFGTDCN